VFRESVSSANIFRAREIRDQSENQMAAIKAIQVIEEIGDVEAARGSPGTLQPGLTIQIITSSPTVDPRVIEHEPRDDDEG
jgi:hypothetical protein